MSVRVSSPPSSLRTETLSDVGKSFLRLCMQRDPSKRPDVSALLLHPFVAHVPDLDVGGEGLFASLRPSSTGFKGTGRLGPRKGSYSGPIITVVDDEATPKRIVAASPSTPLPLPPHPVPSSGVSPPSGRGSVGDALLDLPPPVPAGARSKSLQPLYDRRSVPLVDAPADASPLSPGVHTRGVESPLPAYLTPLKSPMGGGAFDLGDGGPLTGPPSASRIPRPKELAPLQREREAGPRTSRTKRIGSVGAVDAFFGPPTVRGPADTLSPSAATAHPATPATPVRSPPRDQRSRTPHSRSNGALPTPEPSMAASASEPGLVTPNKTSRGSGRAVPRPRAGSGSTPLLLPVDATDERQRSRKRSSGAPLVLPDISSPTASRGPLLPYAASEVDDRIRLAQAPGMPPPPSLSSACVVARMPLLQAERLNHVCVVCCVSVSVCERVCCVCVCAVCCVCVCAVCCVCV